MQNYSIEKVVGEGSFGKALLCRRLSDKKRVIIKQISIAKMSSKEAMRTELEATLLSRLKHPNIVTFIDSFRSSNHLQIVMEFADGGDLDSYVKGRRGKLMSEKDVLHMFVQIALAIKHIHDRKILHRDLKSQNIFLTSAGMVKLGDFGVSRVLERTIDLAATQVGTPYYMPPEICNSLKYNSKCDIWSLGVILFELMTLGMPFKGSSMQQLVRNITSQPVPPVSSSLYSHELRQVLESTLHKNYSRRPGINAILQAPVITSRIANYLDENIKQQEFSHTVLHGAHILKGRPANQFVAQVPPTAAADVPVNRPSTPSSVPVAAAQPPSSQQRREEAERERLLRDREDARRLQRAAEEKQREREKEREREKAQNAALQAARDKEKERERDVKRARERLAAERKAMELARLSAQERQREKDRLIEKEREKERAMREKERAREKERERAREATDKKRAAERERAKEVAEREQALREKALEADRQMRLRREAKAKEDKAEGKDSNAQESNNKMGPIEQAAAAAAALQARRQANLQAFEREREERTKQLRSRLKGQLGAASPQAVVGASPKIKEKEKTKEKQEAKAEQLRVADMGAAEDDDDSSIDSSDLRILGPPQSKAAPTPGSGTKAVEKTGKPSPGALAGLDIGNEWLSQLEQRMGHLKGQVKKLQANSPRGGGGGGLHQFPIGAGLKASPSAGAIVPSPTDRGAAGTPNSNVGNGNRLALRKPGTPSSNHPTPSPSPSTPNLIGLGMGIAGKGLVRAKPALPSPMVRAKKSPTGPVTPSSAAAAGRGVLNSLAKKDAGKVKVAPVAAVAAAAAAKVRDEDEERDKEERRKEREALREKRRLELKAYVAAQREAKGELPSPADRERVQLQPLSSPTQIDYVQSVFKFIITPPQSGGGSKVSKEAKADRPSSARSARGGSDKKEGVAAAEPKDRVQMAAEREKRSEDLRQAILERKKQAARDGDGGIEIFAPPTPLPKVRSSPTSPSLRIPEVYSQRDIAIARAAEAEALAYAGLKQQRQPEPASIHDLDLDSEDDEEDEEVVDTDDLIDEGDMSQVADLCGEFDFEKGEESEIEEGGLLNKFNSTQRLIFGNASLRVKTNSNEAAASDLKEPPSAEHGGVLDQEGEGKDEDAEGELEDEGEEIKAARAMHETSSASADYHALMRKMQEVLAGPSRILDDKVARSNSSPIDGAASPLFDDETFEEEEENYILLGTPDKMLQQQQQSTTLEGLREFELGLGRTRSKDENPLSPIAQSNTLNHIFHGSIPRDAEESPPPDYAEAVSGAIDDEPEATNQDSFAKSMSRKSTLVVNIDAGIDETPSKGKNELYRFLSGLFGREKLSAALALLQQTLVKSPRIDQAAIEEEEEVLLGKLEEIIGTEGLVHLDDLFYIVNASV